MWSMETRTLPKFMHLHDLGLSLQDSGKAVPVRRTLIRRGQQFAEANGLHIYWMGKDGYVSTAQLERLVEAAA